MLCPILCLFLFLNSILIMYIAIPALTLSGHMARAEEVTKQLCAPGRKRNLSNPVSPARLGDSIGRMDLLRDSFRIS